MTTDISDLVSKVIERAVEKYGEQYGQNALLPGANVAGMQSETILVEALATQVLALFGLGAGSANSGKNTTSDDATQMTDVELLERNRMVARALGACECWGQHHDCRMCYGQGAPGWALPHKPLFDQFVRPALITVNQHRLSIKKNGEH